MSGSPVYSLNLARDYSFARSVLWECLTDEDLLAGWLGEASIEDRSGGPISLMLFRGFGASVLRVGTVTQFEPESAMVWSFDDDQEWTFVLQPRTDDPLAEAISRDTCGHTRLLFTLRAPPGARTFQEVSVSWSRRLDDLGELLHGRPLAGFIR